jgi:hypothetical protein
VHGQLRAFSGHHSHPAAVFHRPAAFIRRNYVLVRPFTISTHDFLYPELMGRKAT